MVTKKTLKNQQKKTLGKRGEQLIKKKLLQNNWTFITQNFYTRFGEIDLIFIDPENTLVFIEVKTRSSNQNGHPEEAISKKKLSNLQKAANLFILKNSQFENYLYRLDAAAIVLSNLKTSVKYYKNIS